MRRKILNYIFFNFENKNEIKEKIMKNLFFVIAMSSIMILILICLFLFLNGIPTMQKIGFFEFLLGKNWQPTDSPASFGILAMILGSTYVTLIAMILGIPIGIFTAVFLARMCPKKLYEPLKFSIELLAGIPSVIYGFWGIIVLVPIMRNLFGGSGKNMITAGILLAIMILPTLITISEHSINSVSNSYYEGAIALGASHNRAVFKVLLPAAKSGIFASIILGIGRAIGETMAVIMVAGNQTLIPKNIFKGVRTLTSNIVIEMGYATDLHRDVLIATGVVLFIFILIINIVFSLIRRRTDEK